MTTYCMQEAEHCALSKNLWFHITMYQFIDFTKNP